MRETRILAVAIAGGVLAASAPARAQSAPPATGQTTPAPVPAPSDAPIVPDDQFHDALPTLDPAINAPLEPIDPTAPAFPPVPGPVEDAPLGDPALSEPLPPLSSFEVQPAGAEPASDADGEAQRVRYTLVVEGMEETGLEGAFRALSALDDAEGNAVNGAMIAARAAEDEALVVRVLRAEGYYDAVANSAIEQLPEAGRLRVTLTVAPGNRYNFGTIAIDGPDTEPPGMARRFLALTSGHPIRAVDVEAAEANVLLRLPQEGYPFPELKVRDILLDPETRLGDYTLPFNPGPRARFAGFTTLADEGHRLAFDAHHVGVLARFRRGELYDRRKVDDLREAMVSTRLFSTVSAEPVLTEETAEDGTRYVNILVRQDAGPARSIDASIGYNTGEGFRLEGAWEHRNLFPPEGAFRIAAIAGTKEQNLSVRFRRNNWGQRDRALLLQLDAGRRDFAAFQGYTARLYGLVSRESTPIWQKRWTYAYGAELLATNENRNGTAVISLSDAYFIGGLIGQLGYDRSNSLLDPTRGFRLVARVNPEASLRNGAAYYVRNLIDGSAYFPVGDQFVVAGRIRLGSIFGIARDDLAPSRRLYAGGGGSVRGFGFQGLGPRDVMNVPLGGRSLVEFALEGRYRFGNYGVVGFVDGGQVYEAQYPTFDSMRFGVGVGGRVYTNFGPVRVDIATPIGRRAGEGLINVYVSIGQAF